MPQISLYIDEPTLKKIENAAQRQRVSISKWVADQLRSRIDPVYPVHYEDLFGSIADKSFTRPREPLFAADTKREGF
ncbi:MAG: hypothetical protein WCL37_03350 [Chrysiogenales bacterium]